MRKIFVAVLATSMLFAMAANAFATHRTGSLDFIVDGETVEEDQGIWEVFLDDDVTIVAKVLQNGATKDAKLFACLDGVDHVASALCAAGNTGSWSLIAQSPGGSDKTITYTDVNTSVAGAFGYRVADDDHSSAVKDLTVTDPNPAGGHDPHQACKGIENAISKVKDNKGKAKLVELAADKFDC